MLNSFGFRRITVCWGERNSADERLIQDLVQITATWRLSELLGDLASFYTRRKNHLLQAPRLTPASHLPPADSSFVSNSRRGLARDARRGWSINAAGARFEQVARRASASPSTDVADGLQPLGEGKAQRCPRRAGPEPGTPPHACTSCHSASSPPRVCSPVHSRGGNYWNDATNIQF